MNHTSMMVAVRSEMAGHPHDLKSVDTPRAVPAPGEVLIRVRAAGVNRSDVLACRGILPGPFPRTFGRDFAGEVVEGPREWLGRRVWGTGGGDFGLSRDGSHAQFLVAPIDAVCEMPQRLTFVEAAASGLAYFTASAALVLVGDVQPGMTVVVTGAVGGVGSAAACLAASRGAQVIGIIHSHDDVPAASTSLHSVVRSDKDDVSAEIMKATDGEGAEKAVDTVGGPLTSLVLAGMAIRGSVCVLSSPPLQPVAAIDMLDFYRRELRLFGLHTGRLTAVDAATALAALADNFDSGILKPTRVHRTYRLDEAAAAYGAVEDGVAGRPVFVPDHP